MNLSTIKEEWQLHTEALKHLKLTTLDAKCCGLIVHVVNTWPSCCQPPILPPYLFLCRSAPDLRYDISFLGGPAGGGAVRRTAQGDWKARAVLALSPACAFSQPFNLRCPDTFIFILARRCDSPLKLPGCKGLHPHPLKSTEAHDYAIVSKKNPKPQAPPPRDWEHI